MITAYQVAIIAAGIFFLNGLITGVWKYNQMVESTEGNAHPYVDIAHRTSLLYSFAAILIANFVQISQLPPLVELTATTLLVAYFALAILGYMVQGVLRKTENQFKDVSGAIRWFMWTLIVVEIGSFLVLFYGVIVAL